MFELSLSLRPSYLLTFFLILMHGCVLLLLWLLPFQWWFSLVMSVVCVGYFIFVLRKYALRNSKKAVVELRAGVNENWHLTTASRHRMDGKLMPNSVCTPHYVILRFSVKGKWCKVPIVIFKDTLDQMSFRRLRLFLSTQVM